MKIRLMTFLLMPVSVLANDSSPYAPPQSHVRSASIDVVQGNSIYANNNMQSHLRVRYKLRDNIKVTKVTLKEFGSNEELSTIGWNVTETDSGFDHNIGSNSRHTESHLLKDAQVEKNYKNIYVSTSRSNQGVNICFDIETSNITFETSTYSTCEDEGIINGTAKIFAERPKKFYASDFRLSKINDFLYDKDDHEGALYIVTPEITIPRSIDFKLKNAPYAGTYFLDSSDSALLSNPIRLSGNHAPLVSQTTTWLLKPTEDTTFQSFKYRGPMIQTKIPTTYYHHAIAYLFHVKYRKDTLLAGNWRCPTQKNSEGVVYCVVPSNGSAKLERKLFNLEVKPKVTTKMSEKITLIDNYGTEHMITIHSGYYGEGENIFIS